MSTSFRVGAVKHAHRDSSREPRNIDRFSQGRGVNEYNRSNTSYGRKGCQIKGESSLVASFRGTTSFHSSQSSSTIGSQRAVPLAALPVCAALLVLANGVSAVSLNQLPPVENRLTPFSNSTQFPPHRIVQAAPWQNNFLNEIPVRTKKKPSVAGENRKLAGELKALHSPLSTQPQVFHIDEKAKLKEIHRKEVSVDKLDRSIKLLGAIQTYDKLKGPARKVVNDLIALMEEGRVADFKHAFQHLHSICSLSYTVRHSEKNFISCLITDPPYWISSLTDKEGNTLLHHAAKTGKVDFLQAMYEIDGERHLLQAFDTSRNNKGKTPFDLVQQKETITFFHDKSLFGSLANAVKQKASLEQCKEIYQRSISAATSSLPQALKEAVVDGNLPLVRFLCLAGADPHEVRDGCISYRLVMNKEIEGFIDAFIAEKAKGLTYSNIKQRYEELGPEGAGLFIYISKTSNGFPTDENGRNCLHSAVSEKNAALVRFLLSHPHCRELREAEDNDGKRPVQLAMLAGNEEIVSIFF